MTMKEKAFENTVGKQENAGNKHNQFFPFPTMFSTLHKTSFNFHSNLNTFNLDLSEILSFDFYITRIIFT